MHLKNTVLALLVVFATLSCQKSPIEQVQENLVIKAMTDGQWRITKFTRAGTDITTDFAPYKFQFYANNTVDAINNGTKETTGSWMANAAAKTIAASFSNVNPPLTLWNGVWNITNNSWTFVEATQTVNGEVLTLRLDK